MYGLHDSATTDPHAWLRSQTTGPFWLTGGPFGPEGGVVFLLSGALLGVALLRLAVARGQWRPRVSSRAVPAGERAGGVERHP